MTLRETGGYAAKVRHTSLALLACICLAALPEVAAAQSVANNTNLFQRKQYYYDAVDFAVGSIIFNQPQPGPDGGAEFFCGLDIANYTACRPLNIETCTETPRPIAFTLSSGPTNGAAVDFNKVSSGPNFYLWLQVNDNVCSLNTTLNTNQNPSEPPTNYIQIPNSTQSLPVSGNYGIFGGAYARSGVAFHVPGSLTAPPALNTGVIRSLLPNVCASVPGSASAQAAQAAQAANPNGVSAATSTGTPFAIYRLCFGVDGNGDGIVAGTDSSGNVSNNSPSTTPNSPTPTAASGNADVVGYLNFAVDTVRPPNPISLSTTSLVRRVNVAVTAGTSSDKSETWAMEIRATDDPANFVSANVNGEHNPPAPSQVQAKPCTDWNGNYSSTILLTSTSDYTANQDIPGRGVDTYAYCARNIDYAGNVSPGWIGPKVDAPHYECDIFGCYPNILNLGFCGAQLGGPAWLAVLVAAQFRRQQRRRRRRTVTGMGAL